MDRIWKGIYQNKRFSEFILKIQILKLILLIVKVACWLDESVETPSTRKFEMRAQYMSTESSSSSSKEKESSSGEKQRQQLTTMTSSSGGNSSGLTTSSIIEMSTTNLFTIVRLGCGLVYWWGIMPAEQRAKCVEKYISKSLKVKQEIGGGVASTSSNGELTTGSLVCMKSAPLLHAGSLAIGWRDGLVPCLGELKEHVFHYRDSSRPYKFRIVSTSHRSSISATAAIVESDVESSTTTTTTLKRKTSPNENDSNDSTSSDEDICSWYLNEVVFVDEAKSSHVLGEIYIFIDKKIHIPIFHYSKIYILLNR